MSVSADGVEARRYVVLPEDPLRAAELGRACAVAPVLGQVLLNRRLADPAQARAFLGPRLSGLSAPDAMADRQVAAERLAWAIRRGERIVVFGDYDVDGTTSAVILSGILRDLGGAPRTLVANRFDGGYGLSDSALQRVLAERPDVLVTCDCGSSDHQRIAAARGHGIDVVVVDHHLVPQEPLTALAFLNPHRPDCAFPYKGLCSAGLALSLGAAVRVQLGVQLDLRPYLDLVALGTIADVMPLDGDNRALVRAGLIRLGAEEVRPGLMMLREQAKIRAGTPLSAMDVAFRLTPRLNAAGRLGDPALTVALLQAATLDEARSLAAQIEHINTERRSVEREVTEAAVRQVSEDAASRNGLVAAGEGWHRGVVGITAARLVDRYDRPALVVASDGALGHGSGRAPDGFPLHAALLRTRHLLERFGGHDAAVGFSVRAAQIEALREAFDQACGELARSRVEARDVLVDARIHAEGFGLPRASELRLLEPLGEANPEPLFELRGQIVRAHPVGQGHLKLRLRIGARELDGFGYEMAGRLPQPDCPSVIYGHLRPSAFLGGEQIEVRVVDLEVL